MKNFTSSLSRKVQKTRIRREHLLIVAVISGVFGAYVFLSSRAATTCTKVLSPSSNVTTEFNNATAGSVLCLGDGTYGSISLTGTKGTPTNKMTLTAQNPGRVTLTGKVSISGKNVVVSNLRGTGVNVAANSSDIDIDQNYFKSSGFVVFLNGDNGVVSNVSITNNEIEGAGISTAGGQNDLIDVHNFRNLRIEHNSLHDIYEAPDTHTDIFQAFAGGSGLILRKNYVWRQGGVQGLFVKDPTMGPYENVLVEDNLVVDDSRGLGRPLSFYNVKANPAGPNALTENGKSYAGIARNNTVWDDGGETQIYGNGPWLLKDNVIQHAQSWKCEGGAICEQVNTLHNATFINKAAGDYRLTNGAGGITWNPLEQEYGPGSVDGGVTTPPAAPTDSTPPTVSITAPATNATVSGSSTTINADAGDDIGVTGVQFKIDGTNVGSEDTSAPYSVTWNTTQASNGTHTITAVARDASGKSTASAGRTVTVNNTVAAPPVGCTITVSSLAQVSSSISSASSGSVICLTDGDYGKLTLTASKTSPGVTVRAQNPGKATIAGATLDGSYITVAQFRMTGTFEAKPGSTGMTAYRNFFDLSAYRGYGVMACASTEITCNDVSIIGNKFVGQPEEDVIRANVYHDGPDADSNGLLIEGNEFSGNQELGDHNDVFQSVWVGDHLVFRKNYLHDFGGQGFFVKDQRSPIDGLVAEDNLIIRQNLPCIPDSLCPSWQLSPFQLYGPITNGSIKHNTIWPTASGQTKGGGLAVLTNSTWTNVNISDNVFDGVDNDISNLTGSNNTRCASNSAWGNPPGTTTDCNPAFKDISKGDYTQANGRGVTWSLANVSFGPDGSSTPPPTEPGDTTPPNTTITTNPGASTTSTSASFSFTSSETGSTFECKLDTGSYSGCASPKSYSGLGTGLHNFSVRAKDAAGNIDATPATHAWTINAPADTTAPTVDITSHENNAQVSGIVTFAAIAFDPPATSSSPDGTGISKVEFYIDSTSGTPRIIDTSSPYNYSIDTKTLPNGSHTVTARAYDNATPSNTTATTITVNINNADVTAPNAPTNLRSTSVTQTSVSLAWSASTDTGANQTGVTKYNVLRDGVVIAQPTGTTYTDNGRIANTAYNYVVQAVDGVGNTSSNSNNLSVKTLEVTPTPDTSAPTAPGNFSAVLTNPNQINLSWNASTDTGGSGLAGYNVYRNNTKINANLITSTSYGDTTVSPNNSYTYKVEAVDGAGNKSTQVSSQSITTPTTKRGDVTGPSGTSDGKIDLRDISYVIRNYGSNDPRADVTGPNGVPDGKVDLRDISYLIRNYGS